ncbi:MAG: signal peptidase I [Candidatus Omnitrophica bacterium]|nr:signal peptidase I [Candidatus Omnitrophota bacterium]
MRKSWKKYAGIFWCEWAKPFLMVALVVVTFRSAVADWNDVPTGSMKPTILEGDRIFVNKMAYGVRFPLTPFRLLQWEGPKRGDIVVCFSPHDGRRLCKRVVGVPGDVVAYRNKCLYINGQPMQYGDPGSVSIPKQYIDHASQYQYSLENLDGVDHLVMTHSQSSRGLDFSPVELNSNEYFMMGDNRDESFDSRYFGVVLRKDILGKVNGVVMSLNPDRVYTPRWDRFLLGLQ